MHTWHVHSQCMLHSPTPVTLSLQEYANTLPKTKVRSLKILSTWGGGHSLIGLRWSSTLYCTSTTATGKRHPWTKTDRGCYFSTSVWALVHQSGPTVDSGYVGDNTLTSQNFISLLWSDEQSTRPTVYSIFIALCPISNYLVCYAPTEVPSYVPTYILFLSMCMYRAIILEVLSRSSGWLC